MSKPVNPVVQPDVTPLPSSHLFRPSDSPRPPAAARVTNGRVGQLQLHSPGCTDVVNIGAPEDMVALCAPMFSNIGAMEECAVFKRSPSLPSVAPGGGGASGKALPKEGQPGLQRTSCLRGQANPAAARVSN